MLGAASERQVDATTGTTLTVQADDTSFALSTAGRVTFATITGWIVETSGTDEQRTLSTRIAEGAGVRLRLKSERCGHVA